jgi:hypothetical protein
VTKQLPCGEHEKSNPDNESYKQIYTFKVKGRKQKCVGLISTTMVEGKNLNIHIFKIYMQFPLQDWCQQRIHE